MTPEQLEQAAAILNRIKHLQEGVTKIGRPGLKSIHLQFSPGQATIVSEDSITLARAGIEQAFAAEIARLRYELENVYGVTETVRAVA